MGLDEALDARVRLAVLHGFLDGATPTIASAAAAVHVPESEVRESFRRLAAGRAFVLMADGETLRMAAPFAAAPSGFAVQVESGERAGLSCQANCVWDALGVSVILGGADATVRTRCADCGAALELRVRGGRLDAPEGVVHFAVPAARWWDDIGFT